MAGTSFLKADRRRQAALRREDRQPGRRSHAAGRPGDDRLRRRGREGRTLAPRARRDVRGLADDARAGAARRPAALARLPARGQLVERAVPAHAERVARAGADRGLARRAVQRHQARAVHRGPRRARRSISSATTSSSAARVIREITQRQARRDGARTRRISRARRTSGRRATASAARRRIGCGARRPTARASPGQTNAVSHGCPPARFRQVTVLNTAAVVMLDPRRSADDLRDGAGARQGGGRRGRQRLAAELGRIARAVRRQPHHDQRTLRGSRHHGHRLGRPAARRRSTGNDAERRRAEAAGRRSGADRARLAGAPRVRADARAARVPGVARLRRRHRRRRCRRARRGARGGAAPRAATAKVTGAGFHTARASAIAAATANGNRRYFRSSEAGLQRDGAQRRRHGSGYYAGDHFDLARLDAKRIAEQAVDKAVRSREPKPIEPGVYPVILEPQAVADLIGFLTSSFDARTADEGRSAFSAKDGKTRARREAVQRAAQPLQRSDASGAAGGAEHRRRHSRVAAVARSRPACSRTSTYSRFWAQERKREPTPGPGQLHHGELAAAGRRSTR